MIFYEDTTIEDVLKTFEDFYVKKDYPNALLTLEKNAGEIPPGLLHYNLGTVYSKLENLGLARYHFLMAREFGFSRSELDQNQELIEKRIDVERLERPLNFSDHLVKASLVAKDGILASLSLLILIAGLVALRKSRSLWKVLLWSLLVGVPAGIGIWIDSWPRFVTTQSQPLAEGPSGIFRESGELPAGVLVIVKGDGEWREIVYPSRFAGWVRARSLKKLEKE